MTPSMSKINKWFLDETTTRNNLSHTHEQKLQYTDTCIYFTVQHKTLSHRLSVLAGFNYYSKSVPWLSPMHKEGNKPCFIYLLIYDCTTFTSHVNVLNKILSEPKVSKSLYIWVLYLLLDIVVFMKTWFASTFDYK